ncbi:hypothetical protein MVEN_00325600 [Mycena venus]|uniref:Uncharacterized protein n=1 Tax=Mycena venus TaxID=2733690 RepID=A0A8H6YUI5_9AGAR|nr:hypothetical protein MVEN_00325600 [Mycena venus]
MQSTERFDYLWNNAIQQMERAGVSLLLYGIYVCLFLLSLHTLSRRKYPGRTLLIVASCVIAFVGTTAMAVDVILAVIATRLLWQLVHEQVLNELGLQQTLGGVLWIISVINNFLTDCLFLYRCYVIWGRRREVIVLPGLLIVTTLAIGISPVTQTMITLVLAMTTNVTLTTLTAGRILWMQRDASRLCLDQTLRSRYSIAIKLILESGAIYCIAAMVLFIGLMGYRDIYFIGGGIAQQLLNIIPTFTLVYVGLNHADDSRKDVPTKRRHIPLRLPERQAPQSSQVLDIKSTDEQKDSELV